MPDLLVIVPSRGRPQNIARLLDAVKATCKLDTHLIIGVDDDDPELSRYEYVVKTAGGDSARLIHGPRKDLAGWTNYLALANLDCPFFASLGDDHVPVTPGWDKAHVRAIMEMGGTGFAYPWDGTREDVPEAVIMSSDIVRALGWMCEPSLSHWYVDNVWADLGRGAGCLRHLRAVKVEHRIQGDQTSADSGKKLAADRDAYYAWRRSRMEEDIGKVISLREAIPV